MFDELVQHWQNNVLSFLTESADSVTISYYPERAGTSETYDSFFNESTDPSDPNTVSGDDLTETTPDDVSLTGKVHLDLYGSSIGGSEEIQTTGIGIFDQSDALFTCLLASAALGDGSNRTYFTGCHYVTVAKDSERYEVVAEKRRGMGDAYLLDVFLKKTNK